MAAIPDHSTAPSVAHESATGSSAPLSPGSSRPFRRASGQVPVRDRLNTPMALSQRSVGIAFLLAGARLLPVTAFLPGTVARLTVRSM